MIELDFLKTVGLLRGLEEDVLIHLQECFREEKVAKDEKIFNAGEDATHLWVVVAGQVGLRFELPDRPTSDVHTLSYVGESKSFGWSSLVKPYQYRLSAYCMSEGTRVIAADRECLLSYFEGNRSAGYRVMSTLAGVIAKRFDRQLREVAESWGYDQTL